MGRGKGHGYGCKAGFDRQSNDTGHRCDESASIPQQVFFLFLFNFPRDKSIGNQQKSERLPKTKKSQTFVRDFALQDGLGFKKMKSLETFVNCKKLKYR